MFELLSVILFICLSISVWKNIQFGIMILRIEDSLEECLDVIDKHYTHMSEVLKRPLFLDSPEVRAVVKDIKEVKASLHTIAYVLTQDSKKEDKLASQTKEN